MWTSRRWEIQPGRHPPGASIPAVARAPPRARHLRAASARDWGRMRIGSFLVLHVPHAGHGGRGNSRFSSSTNRVPMHHEDGEPGEELWLLLELKLLADVGLVGFPNAGKSTLISAISAAHPKIADYPFTTLEPNLGVVDMGDFRTFVVADIPGLIEGASEGAGLGDRFLRHVERTKLMLHLVEVSYLSGRDPISDYEII